MACGMTIGNSADWLRWSNVQRSRITGQANTTIVSATTMKISSDNKRKQLLRPRAASCRR